MLGIDGPQPEQIALDHTMADISPSDRALLDFAVKLNNRQKDISRADIDLLRKHNFEDGHILEAVLMVGLAKFANFVSIGLGAEADFDASRIIEDLGMPAIANGSEKDLNPACAVSTLISDEDAELIAQIRAGNLGVFDELVRRHQQRIYRTLMGITRNPDDAEDGLQNVFLKAFQHLGSFQGASKFVTWLTRIAINEGAERLRGRKDFDTFDEQDFDADSSPFRPRDVSPWEGNPEQMYSQAELRQKVEQELLRIPAKYRLPVMLRDLEQFSTEETAEILKIGVPALKSRLLRGRLMLREALAPRMRKRAANV
jgi:RNA polymerase sigma-70 factor (ECF subfamily)